MRVLAGCLLALGMGIAKRSASAFACVFAAFAFGVAVSPLLAQTPCVDSTCVQPQPGFSCPASKLFDVDGATKQVLCVDCRGAQPPGDIQNLPCESNKIGVHQQGRSYYCSANTWRPGPWQVLQDTCACSPGTSWSDVSRQCEPAIQDICLNLEGTQPGVPEGYVFVPPDRCDPVKPPCLAYGATSSGYQWRTGAEPYWNSLIAILDSCSTGWRTALPGNDFIRQGVEYLANRWDLGPCNGEEVAFGNVRVRCWKWWEDIVDTPHRPGPYYYITLHIGAL